MISIATKIIREYFTGKDSRFIFTKTESPYTSPVAGSNLYLHIPFCNSVCPYCPYNKIKYDKAMVAPYVQAMLNEIELYYALFGRLDISSIYIGGGTPTLLSGELKIILNTIRDKFNVRGDICIETNPAVLDDAIIDNLKACGVSLISVGVQSFQDKFLRLIGRKYRASILDEAVEKVVKANFKSVNLDLMFALPGQNKEDVTYDLRKAIEKGVNQVTMYPLFTFPYSSVGQYLKLKKVRMPNLITRRALYYHLYHYLTQHGFNRVSVWGFKKNEAPRYSSVTRDNYIGLGAGAGSHVPQGFYLNTFSVEEYIKKCLTHRFPTALRMDFTRQMQNYFWLYWRFYDTYIPKQELSRRFTDKDKKINRLFTSLKKLDLLADENGSFTLSKRGAFWLHLLQNYFSLRYVNKVWSAAMKQAYPPKIDL
ncbi:MAG: coproporphyrinogen-III oxidase family protein [Candidatus Omnitrophica bacterium]|nr:coproporphyrinogen-III oxidase family protein [Candidatus Omnitrophota bacterium]